MSSRLGAVYRIFPYTYLLFPMMMGFMISLTAYDKYLKKTFDDTLKHYQPTTTSEDLKSSQSFETNIIYQIGVTMFPVGGFFGSFLSNYIASYLGRKLSLVLFEVLGILGTCVYLASYWTSSFIVFSTSRFLHGTSSGAYMNIGLVQGFQLMPQESHSRAKLVIQTLINTGIFISCFFAQDFLAKELWILNIIPLASTQLLMLIISSILPEGPDALIHKGTDQAAARKALEKLRPPGYDIEGELKRLVEASQASLSQKQASVMDLLKDVKARYALFVTSLLMLFQQFSGINVVIFYATNFMKAANFLNAALGILIMLSFGVLAAGSFIFLCPLRGPKFWMITSYGGMSISFLLAYLFLCLDFSPWLLLFCICLFLFFFNTGSGSLTWPLFHAIFTIFLRAAAQTVLSTLNWLGNIIISGFGLNISKVLYLHPFLMFGILNLFYAVLLFIMMVEPGDRTPEEVTEAYRRRFTGT